MGDDARTARSRHVGRHGRKLALGLLGTLLALGGAYASLRGSPVGTEERGTVTEGEGPAGATAPTALAPVGQPVEASSGEATRTGACRIAGLVRRAGRPVEATIEVRRGADGAVLVRIRSGRDGTFDAPRLPAGACEVHGATEDGARGAVAVSLRADGQLERVVLELLTPACTLRGAIVREEGTPFVGTISLRSGRGEEPWSRSAADADDGPSGLAQGRDASTDASGRFEMDALTPGPYDLEVHDGDAVVTVPVSLPRPEELRLVLPSRGETIDAVVVDRATGRGIAEATVDWTGSIARGRLERTLRTDAFGHVALPATVPGWWTVRAPGYASLSDSVGRSGPPPTRFELDRTVRVRGRATFAAGGRPAVGLVVEASSAVASRGAQTPAARTTTDVEGRYLLEGLSPGEVSVRVRDAKGIARGMEDLSLEDLEQPLDHDPLAVRLGPGSEGTLDLAIVPAAHVVGRLTDDAGAPVAGALVTASRPGRSYRHAFTPPSYWGVGRAATDAEGRFELRDLLPGWTYEVVAARGTERARGTATAAVGGAGAPLSLTFGAVAGFEARVVDETTGAGVAGVELVARTEGANGGAWWGRTGDDGFVRIGPLPTGAVWVRAWDATRWELVPERVTLALDAQRGAEPPTLRVRRASVEAEIRLVPQVPVTSVAVNGHELSGDGAAPNPLTVRVVDAEGAPVPRARLRWSLRVDGSGTGGSLDVVAGTATVERRADPAVSAWITVGEARGADGERLPLGVARAGPIPDGTGSLELRLPPVPWVEGRVLDESGRGVRGIRVRLVIPGADSVGGYDDDQRVDRTDASGRFRLVGLGDAEQCLLVPVPEHLACVAPVPAPPGGPPLEIRLRNAVSARVTVTGPNGRPAPGLEVRAWDFRPTVRGISDLDWTSRSAYGTTDGEGIATLQGLDPEGSYSLYVKLGERDGAAAREVRRDAWKPADTAVALRGERDLRGFVRDPAGRPLPGARVVAYVARRWVAGAVAGADGSFTLHDDGQEGLFLYATVSEGQGPTSVPVAAPAGDEVVVLVLDPGLDLSVRLVGAAVARRTVVLTSDPSRPVRDNDEVQHARTDPTGRVRFRGLRPGVGYALWVAPLRASWLQIDPASDETTALVRDVFGGTPAPEVEVRLEPGRVLVARAPAEAAWSGPSMRATLGLLSVDGTRRPDGAFEFRGLLDGEWDVVVEAWGGGQRYVGRGRPGAEVSLAREASAGRR